ncbi:hypothetical protein FOQG_00292 [Fusarium oxysporum f. sp. raphani 54005]|uniref:Uncharacterized protein n=3 Tax=Fusarium oxysporum TaxID=5507 RepID=X0CZF5_FUSOX|nr:hypothetical protein FOVG_03285 [Fusarium oxysporum f. sp. pisi HDV247]EXK99915.1 hypothetical protein FOQG_00292 [Fusarium oxysporum f. sp. raphani 54005]EXL82229.1 hypothetical protein FOPG_04830 [Fusarium oxysporum f. sp. conglutinans race 2 54008]
MSQSKIKLVRRSLQASTKTPIPMNLIGTPEQ